MQEIFEIASQISTPLTLGGFFAAILFFIFRQILQKNIFPSVTKNASAEVIKLFIDRLFVLALIAMVLGFVSYTLPKIPIQFVPYEQKPLLKNPPEESNLPTNNRNSQNKPSYNKQPDKWKDYEGFDNLVGNWHGKLFGSPPIEIEIPYPMGDDVVAKMYINGTSCAMSLNLERATQMFSSSIFYFRQKTITASCPDVDYIKITPSIDIMTVDIEMKKGKPIISIVTRKI